MQVLSFLLSMYKSFNHKKFFESKARELDILDLTLIFFYFKPLYPQWLKQLKISRRVYFLYIMVNIPVYLI